MKGILKINKYNSVYLILMVYVHINIMEIDNVNNMQDNELDNIMGKKPGEEEEEELSNLRIIIMTMQLRRTTIGFWYQLNVMSNVQYNPCKWIPSIRMCFVVLWQIPPASRFSRAIQSTFGFPNGAFEL